MGRRSITLICAECGAEFIRKPSHLSGEKDYYCSLQCAGNGYRKNFAGTNSVHYNSAEIECGHCGKKLVRRISKIREHNFCSSRCLHKWRTMNLRGTSNPLYHRIQVVCRQCGIEFGITPARVNPEGNFCSHTCYGLWRSQTMIGPDCPNWKGGTQPYYGPNWPNQRRKTRERDGYRCQYCGVTEAELGRELDVHHIVTFRSFGYIQGENENYKDANQLINLITYCHLCHKKAEHGKIPVRPKLL